MTPVEVCNLALLEVGNRVQIGSLNETSPAAQACRLLYTPKLQMLSRSAPWDSLRAQLTLTQLKAAIVNGAVSSNPPPQPWGFEYAWPVDCLKARFIIPTYQTQPGSTPPLTTAPNISIPAPNPPTSIPFVVATDNINGNNVKVILTDLGQAQLIYNRDLTQQPDLWDSLFLSAATALLGAYLINALARNKAQFDDQVALAKNVIDQARAAAGNEGITTIDHTPDWLQARFTSGIPWAYGSFPGAYPWTGWDSCELPGGYFY